MRHTQDKDSSLTTFFSAAEVEESGELGLPSTVPTSSCVGSVVVVVASVVVSRLDRASGAVVEKSRVKLYAVVVDGAIVDEVEVALVDEVVLLDSDTTSAARVDCIWVMDAWRLSQSMLFAVVVVVELSNVAEMVELVLVVSGAVVVLTAVVVLSSVEFVLFVCGAVVAMTVVIVLFVAEEVVSGRVVEEGPLAVDALVVDALVVTSLVVDVLATALAVDVVVVPSVLVA